MTEKRTRRKGKGCGASPPPRAHMTILQRSIRYERGGQLRQPSCYPASGYSSWAGHAPGVHCRASSSGALRLCTSLKCTVTPSLRRLPASPWAAMRAPSLIYEVLSDTNPHETVAG